MLLAVLACTRGAPDSEELPSFRVLTFNTGTSEGLDHEAEPDDGYGAEQAALSDAWYGDGLAWLPAVEATTTFLDETRPAIAVFQEIFYAEDCAGIPEEARAGFVCSQWSAGDPTVAQVVLGEGWQVLCHPGHPDKCLAVHRDFGRFEGCDEDFCVEGAEGSTLEGCGKGARVGRAVIGRVDGSRLTLVNVHGSSGASSEDMECRVRQVEQVFVDLGDGRPAADGELNLVLGDLNTDPGRLAGADPSAQRWLDFTGEGQDFHFLTALGPEATPTYGGLVNIDHVVSDGLSGECRTQGIDSAPVYEGVYFDHLPVICELH